MLAVQYRTPALPFLFKDQMYKLFTTFVIPPLVEIHNI